MTHSTTWLYYRLKWKMKRVRKLVFPKRVIKIKRYGNNKYILPADANKMIKKSIESNRPFSCCRFGISEFNWVVMCQKDALWGTDSFKMQKDVVEIFELYSGDSKNGIMRFAELMRESCGEADYIGVWNGVQMGDYYISSIKNMDKKIISSAIMVEPYYFDEPWSEALKGKKVLVISPFVEEIEKQYKENRERLFQDKRVLPEFELLTQESVWFDSSGKDSRFQTWFDAYNYIYEEAMKKEFDIVLLGCGPFGFPLATRFKMAGKQAIHVGGALQILFGIKGKRWEENKDINKFFNEYWIRPEKPKMVLQYKNLDDACYW